MTLKSDAKFEEKLLCCFKNDKNLVIQTLETLKISTLIGFFCAKYLKFNLAKYRGVIFHETEV